MNWAEGPLTPKKSAKKEGNGIAVAPAEIDDVVQALDRVPAVRKDLEKVVAGVKVMAHSGLTLEALALLVHDKCEWGDNRKQIPLSSVRKVIKAMLKLDEHLVTP